MDDIPIAGGDEDRKLFQQLVAHYDAPAYVRRGRRVQEAFDQLLGRCRQQRDEWLGLVRLPLATLLGLAGDPDRLRPLLQDDGQIELLRRLEAELAPKLLIPVRPTSSLRALRRALRELAESLEHFNRRWRKFLAAVDLTEVNTLREGYNRYYLLEKECAMRSPRLARQGFRKLEPLTVEELIDRFPALPVPPTHGRSDLPVE